MNASRADPVLRGRTMNPREVLAIHDHRELLQSFGVAQSSTDFACPKCSARSFAVLHGLPMEVECLKCGTVAPFSVAASYVETAAEAPRAIGSVPAPIPSYLRQVGTRSRR